jgi:hypothetical protein
MLNFDPPRLAPVNLCGLPAQGILILRKDFKLYTLTGTGIT